MFDNNIIVYKFNQDLHFFVIGGDDENELILDAVLNGFYEAVDILLRQTMQHIFSLFLYLSHLIQHHNGLFRNKVDKYEALGNLDIILLCIDEIVDGG